MRKIKRIYQATVAEFCKDNLIKVWCDIFYKKEEAIQYCKDIVYKRFKELENVEVVTTESLLTFMRESENCFKLRVTEYSAAKREYEKSNGYAKAFEDFIDEKGENLYDQILSLVICNKFGYDYFGNLIDGYTDAEGFVEFTEGHFTEEDCMNGNYTGTFKYRQLVKCDEKIPYKIYERYYLPYLEVYREPIKDDNGYQACAGGIYTNLEEAVQYECSELRSDMPHYYTDENAEFMADTSEEQDKEMFRQKVTDYAFKIRVVSGKKVMFDSQQELAEYYAEEVSSGRLTEDNIYDFLLSLVCYEERYYDYEEYFLYSRIVRQELDGTTDYDVIPDFSMETAREVYKQQEKWKEHLYGKTK